MIRILCIVFFVGYLFHPPLSAMEEPIADEINPLHFPFTEDAPTADAVARPHFATLLTDATLTLRSTYYGRSRYTNNANHPGWSEHFQAIHVNAFGQGVDLRSGYAWGLVGFDLTGQTNLGRGRGTSEVLLHKEPGNRDRSSVTLGQAALKTKIGGPDFGFEARGGFTPISIGSLGTSGGLHSHGYRGFEAKLNFGDFWIGYGWADQFRNEWDSHYRDMTTHWHQNRWGYHDGRQINYVHSLGLRYSFGRNKEGFIDAGIGEGHGYRRNAQLAVSVPFDLGRWGILTITGYGIVARYRELAGLSKRHTEYHVSGSAQLARGNWSFSAGMGHTRSPDSDEMQFRLTAWGNSDNRNFIQTWAQLDDFVWDGQNVVKVGFKYNLGNKIGIPGLSLGATYNYSWNARNPGRSSKSTGWEIDYHLEYVVPSGALQGLAVGIYPGHLRYANNHFHGKQNRNDIKVIISYSRTFERFLARAGR